MVTRGTIFYEFSESRDYSVFSCETQLTWRCYLSRRNSAEWWKVRSAKIRISISLDIPLSWVSPDSQIGTSLTLIRNTNPNQWCDYCKMRWGSHKGEWSLKAMTPAVWKCISVHPNRRNQVRFYCAACADEVQNWSDGTFYSLKQQLMDSITKFARQEQLDVELP